MGDKNGPGKAPPPQSFHSLTPLMEGRKEGGAEGLCPPPREEMGFLLAITHWAMADPECGEGGNRACLGASPSLGL